MKHHILIFAILLGCKPLFGLPLYQELAALDAQRQAELDGAAKDINGKYRQRYLALLPKAVTEKDPLLLARVKIAVANVSTISPEQYAMDALVNKTWIFEVPRVGYKGSRIFTRDGKWTSEDDKPGGTWKLEHGQLKVFLTGAPNNPEIFGFPIKADKWFGIGSQQDVLYLSLAPDSAK
jgi:hypothetical protein